MIYTMQQFLSLDTTPLKIIMFGWFGGTTINGHAYTLPLLQSSGLVLELKCGTTSLFNSPHAEVNPCLEVASGLFKAMLGKSVSPKSDRNEAFHCGILDLAAPPTHWRGHFLMITVSCPLLHCKR